MGTQYYFAKTKRYGQQIRQITAQSAYILVKIEHCLFEKKGNISIWEAEFLGMDSDPKDFILQDDENLVVYDECGEILWESKTSGKCNAIPRNLVIQ